MPICAGGLPHSKPQRPRPGHLNAWSPGVTSPSAIYLGQREGLRIIKIMKADVSEQPLPSRSQSTFSTREVRYLADTVITPF